MSSDKRPPLTSDDNQPKLHEPKPPFGLERERWNRLRLRVFVVVALLTSLLALWIITRRNQSEDAHRIQGDRLASYYSVASEGVGCDTLTSQEPAGGFVGVHQGFPMGPVLVECSRAQECATVSQRDPGLGLPAIIRGPLADVDWRDWAAPPGVLDESDENWAGTQRRSWRRGDVCHQIERRESLALESGRLTQSTEIFHGSRACTTNEPEMALGCVFRRVRELRAPRR